MCPKLSVIFSCCITLLHSCKKFSSSAGVKTNSGTDVEAHALEFENAGKCTVLDLISRGQLTYERALLDFNSAQARVRDSRNLWTAVARERLKNGNGIGVVTGLQTRGYIEPMYLADIRPKVSFTGSNAWDTYESLTALTKQMATRFAGRLSLQSTNTLSISEIFQAALAENNGDIFKSAGYLGALTVWDRWNAEYLALKGGGDRNQYTVLPHLLSPIGEGDISGQTYHFWGFVALLMGNGRDIGLQLGTVTTVGYEIVRNWINQKPLDMEDYDIDRRAMGFAVGMFSALEKRLSSKEVAAELKDRVCSSKPSQASKQPLTNRTCEIWIGNAGSYESARRRLPEFNTSNRAMFVHFNDFIQCSVRAKRAVLDLSHINVNGGLKPNFSAFKYAGGSRDEKVGILSSEWIADGVGHPGNEMPTKHCKSANKIGGTCGELKQVVTLELCPKQDSYQNCVVENSRAINYLVARSQACLTDSQKFCVPAIPTSTTVGCYVANNSGGSCADLNLYCASRYCKRSSRDFANCKDQHELAIRNCMLANQHCLENNIDKCVPLKELDHYMDEPLN